jgi:HSP20 family molecular chaperone IbpA
MKECTMTTRNELTTKTREKNVERVALRPSHTPPVDIFENAEDLLLVADFPGVRQEDVDIRFEKNQLYLRGHVSWPAASKAEIDFDWTRTFVLPAGVNANAINAELKHGVLRVRLPKHESLKQRQIAVRAG